MSAPRVAPLWGTIGGLSFLVLVQAFELLAGVRVSWLAKFGVALAVAVVAALLTPAVVRQVRARNGQV